jgi:hypothetical protein
MVRTAFRVVLSSSLLLLLSLVVCAQSQPPRHPPNPKVLGPAKWDPSPQEVSAAYWTLEPGWSTQLEMRNNLRHHDLTITPVLRTGMGEELSLASVTIPSQHIVTLDLRDAGAVDARILDHTGSFGSVSFRFSGLDAANLFAATIVRRDGHPINFHFDADDAGTPVYRSSGIEGIWWLPAHTSTDYLILSNPSRKTVAGSLALSEMSRSDRPIPLSIGPGETKRFNLREVLGRSARGSIGGLSLVLPNNESLSATQIVFDEVTGLTAIMKLFDRDPDDKSRNHVLLAPMMALSQPDPGLGFPDGTTLSPHVFLRNAGMVPEGVSVAVNWRTESKSGNFALPPLNLSSGDVKLINLSDYESAGEIPPEANWGTVKIDYTGNEADLVAVALSYDKDNRYGLQTPFSEALSRLWAGGMWHVDGTHNTLIATGNGGSESTTAEVTLFYNGGKDQYRMQKLLSPGQQLWLDVGHLVHDQVPDAEGRTLPPDTMSGSYELRDVDHATVGQLYEGKLVIDKTYGHAAYGCGTCCGFTIPSLTPTPFTGVPGINNDDVMQTTEQCGGDVDDITDDAYGWQSSNTAVATLPTRTLHTVAPGSATGSASVQLLATHPAPRCPSPIYTGQQQNTVTVGIGVTCSNLDLSLGSTAPGSTVTGTCTATGTPTGGSFVWTAAGGTINLTPSQNGSSATYTSTSASSKVGDTTITVKYTYQSQQPVSATSSAITVHKPTTLVAGVVAPNGTAACTLPCLTKPGNGTCSVTAGTSCTYNANQFQREYKVYDQFNNFFQSVGINFATVTENITLTSNNCGGSGVSTGSSPYTDFFDDYGKCDSCCESGGPGCTTVAAQSLYVNGFSVRNTTITETCTAVTVNP